MCLKTPVRLNTNSRNKKSYIGDGQPRESSLVLLSSSSLKTQFAQALGSNPPNAPIDITTHGSDWLWAVFALFALADLASESSITL